MVHVAVIGAYGSAGVAAAQVLIEAAEEGHLTDLQLSLIDGGEPGGLCILRGCMPSKDVLSAGGHRFQARHDHRLTDPPSVDIDTVVEQKREHVVSFAGHREAGVDALADRDAVTLYTEPASFVDAHTLAVGDDRLSVDYTIVATGSNPLIPPIPGIDTVDVQTSADVLDATTYPESAIVLGFGFIGMELAPYLSEVGGMDVTIVDRNPRPLDDAEPDFGDELIDLYESAFDISVITDAEATAVESGPSGITLRYRTGDGVTDSVNGEQLYSFTGRRPNIDGLNLEAAGIDAGPDWVDNTLQSVDAEHVFVVGDANGRNQLLHVAKEEGFAAAENIIALERGEEPTPYDPIDHRVVFSALGIYPYVHVGHTPSSAVEAGYDVITATRRASDDGVFRVKGVPAGLATLVVDGGTGEVLGYQGLHHHADVFAKLLQVIIETGLRVDELPDRAYHPTTPELLDGLIRETAAEVGAR